MAEVLGAVTSNGLAATVAEVRVTVTSNRDQRDPACTDLTLVRSGIVETISTCRPHGGKWFGIGTTIAPPPGQEWVQHGDQYLLVAITSGLIDAILRAAAPSQ
jgi:hypothetical protein